MLAKLPKMAIALITFWILSIGTLYYNLIHEYQSLAHCRANLTQLELIHMQIGDTETKLEAREAALDAADAPLDGIAQ